MEANTIPIVDTHIHLFDPRRPQGIPWPSADDEIRYKPALPARFRALAEPLGVVAAIELECSSWVEDNQWVLDVAEDEPIMVGTVGFLEPAAADFAAQLERFAANPLFRGIRYGNLWDCDIREELKKPRFTEGLRLLAARDLSLDTANPTVELLEDMLRVTDLAPDLRIVIDHLPKIVVPAEQSDAYQAVLQELGRRPQVYVKVSGVLLEREGGVAYDVRPYRPMLDEIWETFGEDRLLYASDWPNSDPLGSYAQVLAVVKQYFDGKGREASEKYFWRNSLRAYGWKPRTPDQPS
jgi:L-fuconolactonase